MFFFFGKHLECGQDYGTLSKKKNVECDQEKVMSSVKGGT